MEIQTTIEKLPEAIKNLGISPKTSIRIIIDNHQVLTETSKPKTGRWAKVVERISKDTPLNEEAGEALRQASREFRDNFRFREPSNFEQIKNDN
jgi:hypothetical protein